MFEELLFWIENGQICCITTPNLQTEWHRDKGGKKSEIINDLKLVDRRLLERVAPIADFRSLLHADAADKLLTKRIERLDHIFTTMAMMADCEEEIYIDAVKRNLACIAPNHIKDSLRDTVNILTILRFVKEKNLTPCLFVTNDGDFNAGKENKLQVHIQLESDFKAANLEYIFFETDNGNFGGTLFHKLRSFKLPSLRDHLREEKSANESRKLQQKKQDEENLRQKVDPSFLENLPHIDLILDKPSPSELDREILDIFFRKHPGYKEYFMKNLGNQQI